LPKGWSLFVTITARKKNAKNKANEGKIVIESLLKKKQLLLPKFVEIINEDSCFHRFPK
jgi:hypothetical protein